MRHLTLASSQKETNLISHLTNNDQGCLGDADGMQMLNNNVCGKVNTSPKCDSIARIKTQLESVQDITNQVSKFIEGIRLQTEALGVTNASRRDTSNSTQSQDDILIDEAHAKSEQKILEAEHFKAAINTPPGMNTKSGTFAMAHEMTNQNSQLQGESVIGIDVDDQFFHITCHVDQNLRTKIQKGEYVDLEKLLPKSKFNRTNDNKLDLVYRDGHPFFIPANTESKINGIRRWEQAFRVYAVIYSQANPHHTAEIWQYIHVINMAASAYIWENVANYYYTFRQLMSSYPNHNWAKIYNQMWNIAM